MKMTNIKERREQLITVVFFVSKNAKTEKKKKKKGKEKETRRKVRSVKR